MNKCKLERKEGQGSFPIPRPVARGVWLQVYFGSPAIGYFIAACLLIGFAGLPFTRGLRCYTYNWYDWIFRAKVVTQGVVLRIDAENIGKLIPNGAPKCHYIYTYAFATPDGRKHTGTSESYWYHGKAVSLGVGKGTRMPDAEFAYYRKRPPQPIREGKSVPVKYVKHKPEINRIDLSGVEFPYLAGLEPSVIIYPILALCGLTLWVFAVMCGYEQIRLLQRGLTASVENVETYFEKSGGEGSSRSGMYVSKYTFTTADGRVCTIKESQITPPTESKKYATVFYDPHCPEYATFTDTKTILARRNLAFDEQGTLIAEYGPGVYLPVPILFIAALIVLFVFV